jgi:hypothetical protein
MTALDGVFMNKIKFCKKHNLEKIYYAKHKKYECKPCKREYAEKYRSINKEVVKEKNRLYSIKTRERRQAWVKQDRIENPERYKKYAKKYTLDETKERAAKRRAKKYKITLEQFKNLIANCNNLCEICRKPELNRPGRNDRLTTLLVDHCHKSKNVRGMLCFECNILLGKAKDSIEILKQAILYLEKHEHI